MDSIDNILIFGGKLILLKKLIIISILAIFAYSQFGYYFTMRNQQEQWKETVKQNMLHQLKESDLEIICYTDNSNKIFWEDEDEKDEFSFKGEMYDVVKTKIINGKVFLYCLDDKKEDRLVDQYNSITKNNSASGKKAKDNAPTSFNLFFYEDEEVALLNFPSLQKHFNVFNSGIIDGVISNPAPPPKA